MYAVRIGGSSVRPRAPRARGAVAVTAVAEAPPKGGGKSRGAPQKKVDDQDIIEKGMRELPRPADVQQTLATSFTLGGVGLHSGQYAYVRVRPAYAGEGRYFVRVPEGTNKTHFMLDEDDPVEVDEENLAAAVAEPRDPEVEKAKVELFTQYLIATEEENFGGTFADFLEKLGEGELTPPERAALKQAIAAAAAESGVEVDDDPPLMPNEDELEFEEIIPCDPEKELIIPASVGYAYASEDLPFISLLVGEEGAAPADAVVNPLMLLAALEACGVDNARIEIEGGIEVPVLDNSALGWVLNIQQSGLRDAPSKDGGQTGKAPAAAAAAGGDAEEGAGSAADISDRLVLIPGKAVSVQKGDAFVALYPSHFQKATAGVDVQDAAPIIGQQWYSWRWARDYHFRYELAPARGWVESVDALFDLRSRGHAAAGGEHNFVIGHGTRWWDPKLVRFNNDEPSRYALVELIGTLALLGSGGNSGIPTGHVVAFNADADLLLDFARALVESCQEQEEDVVVDSHALAVVQRAMMDEEAQAREKKTAARKRRADALRSMGVAAPDVPAPPRSSADQAIDAKQRERQ